MCNPGKFLEYFMHFGVFYRLPNIVCFETLGIRMLPQIFRILPAFYMSTVFFGREVQGRQTLKIVESFIHLGIISSAIFRRFFVTLGIRVYPQFFFRILSGFRCVLSVI